LTFTLNSSLELANCTVNEVYVVKSLGANATVTNKLTTKYLFNDSGSSYTIPRNTSSTRAACQSQPLNFPFSTYWAA
jgi:hypothetical protein